MAVRSRRLWGPTKITVATYVAVYTVPADRTAVVRTVAFYMYGNVTPTAAALAVNVGDQDHIIWRADLIPSRSMAAAVQNTVSALNPQPLWDSIELDPGDVLYAQISSGTLITTGFGSLLDGAPS